MAAHQERRDTAMPALNDAAVGGKQNSGTTKTNLWSSLLDGVASAKRLPEKNLLVLGGNPDSQREFLETLSTDSSDPRVQRKGTTPSQITNQFALGYTYQDVFDADHEDILARLSIYLLSEPSTSFAPLLKPLLNPETIPKTLIIILLDWEQPWSWLRELRRWICLLRSVLMSLDDETKIVMEEVLAEWRDYRRGEYGPPAGNADDTAVSGNGNVAVPLGSGEWDEGLGLPLCVVCQSADNIEKLEKEHGWREEEFDYILQFMRTVLLKHGASLIYTTPFLANSLQSLVHSSLGIHSLVKRQPLKHNVIDRDKILVPSNWDSWGKIRIIREGFDMEAVGTAWSIEIQAKPTPFRGAAADSPEDEVLPSHAENNEDTEEEDPADGSSAVYMYEQVIQDPRFGVSMSSRTNDIPVIEIETQDMQEFLTNQLDILERLKSEDEKRNLQLKKETGAVKEDVTKIAPENAEPARVSEHIGPVQFNMGGIQVDAEDMLRKLKEREASRTTPKRRDTLSAQVSPGRLPTGSPGDSNHDAVTTATTDAATAAAAAGLIPNSQMSSSSATPPTTTTTGEDGKVQTEALANFFAGLVKKPGSSNPRPGTGL